METPNDQINAKTAKRENEQVLMTCRYCLLYEMGHCRRTNPLKKEPRYLRLRNGTIVRLQFDCSRCEMLILS